MALDFRQQSPLYLIHIAQSINIAIVAYRSAQKSSAVLKAMVEFVRIVFYTNTSIVQYSKKIYSYHTPSRFISEYHIGRA